MTVEASEKAEADAEAIVTEKDYTAKRSLEEVAAEMRAKVEAKRAKR